MGKSSNKVVLLWRWSRKRLEMRMMTTCVEGQGGPTALLFRGSSRKKSKKKKKKKKRKWKSAKRNSNSKWHRIKAPKSCRKKKNEWPVPTSSSDPHNLLIGLVREVFLAWGAFGRQGFRISDAISYFLITQICVFRLLTSQQVTNLTEHTFDHRLFTITLGGTGLLFFFVDGRQQEAARLEVGGTVSTVVLFFSGSCKKFLEGSFKSCLFKL